MSIAIGVIVLLGAVAGCSGGDDEADDGAATVTTTPEGTLAVSENPCVLSDLAEVEAIFGGPVRVELTDRGCSYDIGEDGRALFAVHRDDGRALGQATGATEVVPDLGDLAVFGSLGGGGSLLLVRVGPDVAQFEAVLDEEEEVIRSRLLGWARAVVPRVAETSGGDAAPADTPVAVCDLLDAPALDRLLGENWTPDTESTNDEICAYRTATGTEVQVGPLTPGSRPDQLETIGREVVTEDGETVAWAKTEVDVGDAAVLLSDPENAGNVELYALEGTDLLRVAVSGPPETAAGLIAARTAAEVFKSR